MFVSTRAIMTTAALVIILTILVGGALMLSGGTIPWFGFVTLVSGMALLLQARRLPGGGEAQHVWIT